MDDVPATDVSRGVKQSQNLSCKKMHRACKELHAIGPVFAQAQQLLCDEKKTSLNQTWKIDVSVNARLSQQEPDEPPQSGAPVAEQHKTMERNEFNKQTTSLNIHTIHYIVLKYS